MIKFKNVTYKYPDAPVNILNNINLTIAQGESLAIMGGNGSGKSTFVKLIAKLINPIEGSIEINTTDSTIIPVGFLFQNPDNQFVAVTVEKEIAFTLENIGTPVEKIASRIDEILDEFSIKHLKTRLLSELSGGEKQKVAIASVMIHTPPILILDEPDSYLDLYGQKNLDDILSKLRKKHTAMILLRVTQYPHEAKKYPRLLVIDNGQIIADDKPENIFNDNQIVNNTNLSYENRNQVSFSKINLISKNDNSIKQINFNNVSFGYENRMLFENINLSLKQGEITIVTGISGSGKTSFSNLICGLAKPNNGKIEYLDSKSQFVNIENIRDKVTGVFQQPEKQFFLPTCLEEIKFGPNNLGQKIDSEYIKSIFDFVGLTHDNFINRDPISLSVGEKRRLAIALSLVMQPNFIVFDEPTCALDPAGVGWFINLALELKKHDKSLIIITHSGLLVKNLTDKLLLFENENIKNIEITDNFFENNELGKKLINDFD
ncbi:MAG: ATP-binding cassette domain-containing protein [candidate division Zixibacteria bacterium]|nr:ATP-binding cassette domain-containing protein [candidate division Zixibacteria bacterium]